MEGYKLPPVMFTEQGANALITAEQLIAKNKDTSLTREYGSAIEKIKVVLQYNPKGQDRTTKSTIANTDQYRNTAIQ